MAGALEGIRVLDMTIWQQGTSASAMLADLGADVIKVEEPAGDPGRLLFRIEAAGGMSGYFQALNRGKRSIAVDLKHPKGRAVLLRLAEAADVFVTNFRPGVTERLGIGYGDLAVVNPGVIYASASGYGPEGPEARQGSFDLLGQARGGLMSVTGEPDGYSKPAGVPLADQTGGILAAFGILAALLHRERTGEGQQVDVSLLGSVMALQSFNITGALLSGHAPQRFPRGGNSPFWNVYRGSDGKEFTLAMLQNRGWHEICQSIGRPELEHDARFANYRDRMGTNAKALIEAFDAAFAQRPAAEWVRVLNEQGVFAAPVQAYSDLPDDPQVQANSYLVEVPNEDGPPVRMVPTPVGLSRTPVRLRALAPELGQHTDDVLREAGYSPEEIESLRREGAVGARGGGAA
jgi:crotonobetainyl-CoA:carnitine CoA-transferase CaiB-like acyl-CoA transferase